MSATQPTTNGINGAAGKFKIEEFPVGTPRKQLKVAMIGAGFAGVTFAIRAQQYLQGIDLTVYEKNSDIGGTWFENTYPGLCCDIPAAGYALTFESNPNWSHFYAHGPEILAYMRKVVDKYKIRKFMKFQHRLTSAVWLEETAQWAIDFDILGPAGEKAGTFSDKVDVVVQGMGVLNRWDWPKIEGLKDFKGTLKHSASYSGTAADEQGKRVAVIGGGSSAIQIVPAVQPHAAHLDNYVRGKTWLAAPFASKSLLERQSDGSNHKWTAEELKLFNSDPASYANFRHGIESEINAVHEVTLKGSPMQLGAVAAFTEMMKERLSKKPEIAEQLIPDFPVACRRLTPGPGYLEALVEDNVGFVSTAIKRITSDGIETIDGEKRVYDTIITATGFDVSGKPRFDLIGRNGRSIQDAWSDTAESYMSVAVGPDFPNYFMIAGPGSGVASGSFMLIIEGTVDYIVKAIAKMRRENITTMAVKQERVNDWQEYSLRYFERTVFSGKCPSWYKQGNADGPVTALWPGSCLHAIDSLSAPRWEDYEYTHDGQKNELAWLGNGWAHADFHAGLDTASYLHSVDYPPIPAE